MTAMNLAHRISGYASIYRELYGTDAHQEALRYALVARSMGDGTEHSFWLEVAAQLEPQAA